MAALAGSSLSQGGVRGREGGGGPAHADPSGPLDTASGVRSTSPDAASNISLIPPPLTPTGKKQLSLQTREGFLKMYNSYCAQTSPPNPAVCSDASLKKVFDRFTSQQSAKVKPAPVDSTTPLLDKAASPA